jgi:hypothetical protein
MSAGIESRQVAWWPVHEFVAARIGDVIKSCPLLGTPAWCDLADDDPRKIAAVLDAAQHWALRLDVHQQQLAEASRDVSGAADWSAIAVQKLRRDAFYEQRPWLRRRRAAS